MKGAVLRGEGGYENLLVLPAQFHCEPKTTLKNSLFLKAERKIHISVAHLFCTLALNK